MKRVNTGVALVGLLALFGIAAPFAFRAWVDWKTNESAIQLAISDGVPVAAAIEQFHAETGRYPEQLEQELTPHYLQSIHLGWYLNGTGKTPLLSLHSNLPEWLLEYDFATRRWTLESVRGISDISHRVPGP